MTELRVLYEEIDRRVQSIAETNPQWPCRKGCDACCRRLARPPELTVPELRLMEQGWERLAEPVRSDVLTRLRELTDQGPIVCPFLDRQAGACLIYEQRPAACRTYGFYVERDKGLYCDAIRTAEESGALAHVVWGNQCAVDASLDQLGQRVGLREWFAGSR